MGRMKPILFNTEMVKAILDGRKTVTRRIANISTDYWKDNPWVWVTKFERISKEEST